MKLECKQFPNVILVVSILVNNTKNSFNLSCLDLHEKISFGDNWAWWESDAPVDRNLERNHNEIWFIYQHVGEIKATLDSSGFCFTFLWHYFFHENHFVDIRVLLEIENSNRTCKRWSLPTYKAGYKFSNRKMGVRLHGTINHLFLGQDEDARFDVSDLTIFFIPYEKEMDLNFNFFFVRVMKTRSPIDFFSLKNPWPRCLWQ